MKADLTSKEKLIKELKCLAVSLYYKKYYEYFLNENNYNSYILKDNIKQPSKPIEPKKKFLKHTEMPNYFDLKNILFFLIVTILIIAVFMTKSYIIQMSLTGILIITIALRIDNQYFMSWDTYKYLRKEYNEDIEKNKEITYYNNHTYPELIEAWKENTKKYLEELDKVNKYNEEMVSKNKNVWDEKVLEAKRELPLYLDFIKLYNSLDKKYYDNIQEIIDILETGRADDLKEAINVLEIDLHNNKMLKEEQKRNDLLKQQIINEENARYQEERYRKEMLRIAEDQTRELEYQSRELDRQKEERNRNCRKFEKAQDKYRLANLDIARYKSGPSKELAEREAKNAFTDMMKYMED